MKHLTRDFVTLPSASCPGTNMYALSIFLIGCGGFVNVGHTNFDLASGSYEVAHGISASINSAPAPTGSAHVTLPTGSHLVSDDDINRILCLKSQRYPRANSGLFRVTSASVDTNTLRIDYRTEIAPLLEQFLGWYLFVDEMTASLTWQSGSNGQPGYGSYNANEFVSASASRVIFRSPDQTSWQVRLCLESLQDVSGACPSGFSIAPGFGGTGFGDYFAIPPNAGPGHDQTLHLHTALYHNTTSSRYRGMVVGLSPCLAASGSAIWTRGQWRISMIVDDFSGSCAIVNRNMTLPTPNSGSGWAAFGLCENEQYFPKQHAMSDPSFNVPRLFVVGSSNPQSNLTWRSQFHVDNNMQVVGFGKRGYPIPGVLSCYSDISNPTHGHYRYLTASVDTPWAGATELLDVEILLGTVDQTVSASTIETIFPLQARRLGKLPFFLQGRANYTQWTAPSKVIELGLLTGSVPFLHTFDGVFMEWGGPRPPDVLTGSQVVVISGTFEFQEGMRSFGAYLPGSDPIPEVIDPRIQDLDATRFRKTYSYYRQVPVPVDVVKGGSNPAKP